MEKNTQEVNKQNIQDSENWVLDELNDYVSYSTFQKLSLFIAYKNSM